MIENNFIIIGLIINLESLKNNDPIIKNSTAGIRRIPAAQYNNMSI